MLARSVVVCCLVFCGCAKRASPNAVDAGGQPTASVSASTAATPAPSDSAATAVPPDDEPTAVADPAQVPTPDDNEKRAARDIHKDNYKEALEQLEQGRK